MFFMIWIKLHQIISGNGLIFTESQNHSPTLFTQSVQKVHWTICHGTCYSKADTRASLSVPDPGFPLGGLEWAPIPKLLFDHLFPKKLHENERNWTERWGRPPTGSATGY